MTENVFASLSNVKAEVVEWLWRVYLAYGMITL